MEVTNKFYEHLKEIMWVLYRFNFKLTMLHKMMGVDFSRCFEYSYCISKIDLKKGDKVLDVGSYWAFFPLFLVKKGADVVALDMSERVLDQVKYARTLGVNSSRFRVEVGDATAIGFPDSSFDIITCISTIEHMSEDGDIKAVKEFNRLLKSGGRVFISVPYDQKYNEGRWGKWFQRYYDFQALEARLIQPSGLRLTEIGFLIGHKARKFSDIVYYKIPRLLRFGTQWSHILFARYFVEKDKADKNDAWIAYLVLEK